MMKRFFFGLAFLALLPILAPLLILAAVFFLVTTIGDAVLTTLQGRE